MITGDNRGSARVVAEALHIDDVHAEVLPADKASTVAELRKGGAVVAMVGDGINDAPASPRRTSASPWAAAPTWPCTPPASR